MTRSLLIAAVGVVLGCTSGPPETAAAPQAAGGCGVRYAVTVANEGNSHTASVYYSDARLMKPADFLGAVRPKDERTFFFRSEETPTAWVEIDGIRVFPDDRPAQQRMRVRIALACDTG